LPLHRLFPDGEIQGEPMPDFAKNFQSLKDSGVIPDIQENMLPPNVHDVISNLSPDEITVLKKIAESTGSHLTLHNKDYHFAVCGL
jgi:hypothetical protein